MQQKKGWGWKGPYGLPQVRAGAVIALDETARKEFSVKRGGKEGIRRGVTAGK